MLDELFAVQISVIQKHYYDYIKYLQHAGYARPAKIKAEAGRTGLGQAGMSFTTLALPNTTTTIIPTPTAPH